MLTRYFALAFGIVYVIVGIVGLIPAFYTTPPAGAPHVDVTGAYGYLFGIFPVNWLHDAVHILTGLAGIICSARLRPAVYYSRVLFLVFGLLTVLGFMPQADTLWGLVPIFGNDTWLHAATSIAGAFFGWVATPTEDEELVPAHA
jgi:membrane associated rhomboid family serine protease